ncbi:DUF6701 domain-containing protein [Rhizobacter sp. SG703]|uniref:DUF6701 domain-containing protein n=1 Tax=Rhizobacter sp. SG703 TaxID=2587140 RepID=UPI001444ADD3|nr:DUF6701 domain-containing protein [Rhizobacter sp. SG703]NKI92760.1 hypothetical protein [Rhizobacter sp. SG703]
MKLPLRLLLLLAVACTAWPSHAADTTKPWITSASTTRCGSVEADVLFSEQVTDASAQAAANYALSGGATIQSATLLADKRTVHLTLSSPPVGSQALTVNNVADLAGNTIAANAQVSVPFRAAPLAGLVGTYYDQNGTAAAYFTGKTLTRLDSTIDFDWSSGSPDSSIPADQFSVRWTGLILVPTSGTYDFELVADNGVRLYVNDAEIISHWLTVSNTYYATVTGLTAGNYIPLTLEFYEESGIAVSKLRWKPPGSSSYVTVPASNLFHCQNEALSLNHFNISASGSQSTCAPASVSITAIDNTGNTYVDYAGSITLGTSTGRGDWSAGGSPAPVGTLDNGSANDGAASYAFNASDAGIVKLKLAETLAQDVVVTVTNALVSGASASNTLAFRDNAFTFAEDASNKISGSDVAVAGRPHDYTASLIRKDPSTGSCGVATDYTGSRALKMWRTDSNGTWTAPTVSATSIPSSQPASNNLTLSFTSGVASFMLDTTDIGRYGLNLQDDTPSQTSSTVSGSSNTLTVRPFAIVVQGLTQGSNGNPGGSSSTDGMFAKAGVNFQATVGAYRWTAAMKSNGTDANDDGLPDSSATLANTTAGLLAPSFSSTVTLSTVSGSQTPAGGILGTLSGGSITGFSGGSATATMQYSEVGSFLFATTSVVSNFIGSGLSLTPTVFNASGAQSARVGRFTPAGFTVGTVSLTNRSDITCASSKNFTYLGQNFQLKFTLTAVNGAGVRTKNYTGLFAMLDVTSATAWQLGGVDGSTRFLTSGSSPRLALGTSSGAWGTGSSGGTASNVTLVAAAQRGATPDGPFTASFGIAPVDSDGVAMSSYNLDTDTVSGYDRTLLTTVPLRYGRLKLSNAVGSQGRVLNMPLTAQYWMDGSFQTNTSDHCTSVPPASVSFGNHRKTLTAADTTLTNSSILVANGVTTLLLAAPSGNHSGTVDVALSLDTVADNACLQPWTPGKAATAGAGLAFLRGGWCGSGYDKDPAARAAFGVFHGTDRLVDQRENY